MYVQTLVYRYYPTHLIYRNYSQGWSINAIFKYFVKGCDERKPNNVIDRHSLFSSSLMLRHQTSLAELGDFGNQLDWNWIPL